MFHQEIYKYLEWIYILSNAMKTKLFYNFAVKLKFLNLILIYF